MSNQYEMVDTEAARVEFPPATNVNYISANFKIVGPTKNDQTSTCTVETTILDQLSQNPRSFQPTTTYGSLESSYVDESCYIRPKYLRFALHEGVLSSLKVLLCEKWQLKPPRLLIQVYGTCSKDQHSKIQELVRFGNKTNAWFMANKRSSKQVATFSRLENRSAASSIKNIVFWENWADVEEKDDLMRPQPEQDIGRQDKKVHVSDWEMGKKRDEKIAARQSACFLFPEYSSKDEDDSLRDHLLLMKEFAKVFDNDGHREICPSSVRVHVCSALNVWTTDKDSPYFLTEDEKKELSLLLSSGIPTVILLAEDDTAEPKMWERGEFFEAVFGADSDFNGDTRVLFWAGSSATPFNLSLAVRDLLTESRADGLTTSSDPPKKAFKKDVYTKFYLSLVFDMESECENILTSETKPGIRGDLVSMIYFYKERHRAACLELCIKNNYAIKECLYGSDESPKHEQLLPRHKNSITENLKKSVDTVVKNEDAIADVVKREQLFYDYINNLIGKDRASSFEEGGATPTEDPDCMSKFDLIYLYYCFNEEWDMAAIIRKYSDYTIFKCFLAIKAMQKIKAVRVNTVTTDYFDVKQLDDHIRELDDQAGRMAEWSYKKGLDIGPVVFWEHNEYTYKSILDLAGETQCYGILEDATNVHHCITKRWNGALDSTTCLLYIVLSWLTFGLLAPSIINYVPKRKITDETTLFFNEMGGQRSWGNKWRCFWRSPRSKCYLLMLTYLVFLYFLTVLILDNTRVNNGSFGTEAELNLRNYIIICLVFVLSFLAVEIDIGQVTKYNYKSKLLIYLRGGYNQVDLFSAFMFLLYVTLVFVMMGVKGNENLFFTSKIILSLCYISYIVRFTQFLQLFEAIGPKLISIKNMFSDLIFFASFLLLTIFAYGIVSEFLLHPYARTVPTSDILEILKRPYVNMFGELDLDTFESGIEKGVCKYEVSLNQTLAEAVDCDSMSNYTCGTICKNFKLTARVLLGIYTMVTVILLTNLLVSIFGKTYEKDFDKTRQLWQLQRYKLVKESEAQCVLPFPPFNFLHALYKLFCTCSCCKTQMDYSNEYYKQHVKEIEYRCSRQMVPNIYKESEDA